MPSAVVQAIENLIKSGNADNEPASLSIPSGGSFQVINVYSQFRHLFNENAKNALDNKTHHLIYQYNQPADPTARLSSLLIKLKIKSANIGTYHREFDSVRFFGSRCTPETADQALAKVINALNTVADMGFTKAALFPLGIVHLQDCAVIISYVTLTDAGKQYMDANMKNILFEEAGIPEKVENQ